MVEILRVDATHPDSRAIDRAAACLRNGGLVAFPTETVYGLGADATSRSAVGRIFAAKGRPSTDPLIVHVANLDAVRPLVAVMPDVAIMLAAAFWPGPLTLVLKRSSVIGDDVTAGLDSVGVRVPAHAVARALVVAAGVPVAAPSANLFSRPSPTRAEHVVDDLGDRIDLILDAGATRVGVESTVLDLTSSPPRVLRPGGVSVERLRELLPDVVVVSIAPGSDERAAASPGMLHRHYSPSTPLTLLDGQADAVLQRASTELRSASHERQRLVLLGSREMLAATRTSSSEGLDGGAATFVELGSDSDPDAMAARLYVALRECDHAGGDCIIAMQVSDASGIGLALRDRLRRAAAGRVVMCS